MTGDEAGQAEGAWQETGSLLKVSRKSGRAKKWAGAR